MNAKNKPSTEKGGFALLVVLLFIAAISTFLAMLSFSSSQRAFTSRHLTQQIKATAMAEAGCEYGYAILSTDWASRYDSSKFSSFSDPSGQPGSKTSMSAKPSYSFSSSQDGASYNITVDTIGDSSALVTTTGTCGSVSAESIVSVQNLGGASDNGEVLDNEAFSYGILCGKEIHFTGCGTITTPGGTKIHSNGAMILSGTAGAGANLSSSILVELKGNAKALGDVTAKEVIYKKALAIGGTVTQTQVANVAIPDIDLTPYYNWALDHGEVHNGFSTSSSYTPNGGILWVNGDVMCSGGPGTTINGSIIATGQIHISGQVNVTPSTCAFGLAARDGEIQVTSTGTLRGLIYCKKSNFHMTANGTVIGQIIVNGDIEKAGNSDILSDFEQNVPSPPGSSVTTDYIAIAAWQK